MYQNNSQLAYSSTHGIVPTNGNVISNRNPNSNDIFYPIGQFWINTAAIQLWYLNSQSNASGALQSTWELISVSSLLASLSDTANTPVFPSSSIAVPPDNIQLVSANGNLTIVSTPGSNLITFTATTGTTETLTGNSGGAIAPVAGNINTVGGSTINAVGTTGTITFNVVSASNTILVGTGATSASTPVGPGTTNTVLIGNTGSAPSFGQVPNGALVNDSVTLNNGNNITVTGGTPLVLGGTASFNLTGTTQFAVQVGSSTGALASLALGTAGQVLTSNGAGANPTFQNTAASTVTSVSGTNGVTASPTTGAVIVSGVDATTTTLGVASFNGTQFTVTAGAVSLINGSNITGITVDAATGSGTNPVLPTAGGLISIIGGPMFATGSRANPIEVVSTSANTASLEIQLAGSNAGTSTPNDFGVAQFNSNNFNVSSGYVSSNNITINTIGGISGGGAVTLGGTLTISGSGSSLAYKNINHAASPYTVLSTDQYLSCDTSGGTVVLLFPNAPTAFQTWIVKDRLGDASTNNISITTVGGSETIDGLTTYAIKSNFGAVQLIYNTANYEIY
jgi:hypothetical protein